MMGYLRLELLRALRDPRYVILALAAPVGFYLLFTSLFDQGPGAGGLPTQMGLMVSMSVFGAMWAMMLATGPRIAQDRSIGWQRQLRLLPIRTKAVLVARLCAAVLLAAPAILLVMLTAVIAYGVTLDAWRWVVLLGLLWVGAIPFALLGVAVGYAADADSAFGVLYALYLVLAALGGLWMPLSQLPPGLQNVGKLLPSYRAGELGWRLVGGHGLDVSGALILVAWAVFFAMIARYSSTRVARARA